MRQAITTKYLPATNFRGARIKARAEAGQMILAWDNALNVEDNHRAAAIEFCRKVGWPARIVGGSLPGAGYCFVQKEG